MRIVFSRKGFDSKFGGGASPIVGGRPLSLPIPGSNGETTTYRDRGLSGFVERASKGVLSADAPCHDDPMFDAGHCWLGQVGSAQGHLRNQRVRKGDIFLFFGLFADEQTGRRHHRIFGYMRVAATGGPHDVVSAPGWRAPPRPHPHFSGRWRGENAIWFGPGSTASTADPRLRLSDEGENEWSRWRVPEWLIEHRPSYLKADWRWDRFPLLDTRGIWQEAVCDIGRNARAMDWLSETIALVESG